MSDSERTVSAMKDDVSAGARAITAPDSSPSNTPLDAAPSAPTAAPSGWPEAPLWAAASAAAPARSSGWVARFRGLLLALTLVALCVTFAPSQPGVSVYLTAATQARAVYRYDVALADYAQAHSADSADPRPLCASGDVYILQRLPRQAAAAFRACATLAPGDGSAWLRLGDALATTGDDAGAVGSWRRAGAAGDSAAYHRLAERAEGLDQLDEAARWWSQAPQADLVAQGQLGLLALAQGNVAAAQARFFALSASSSPFAAQLRTAGIFELAARAPISASDEERIGAALLTLGEPAVALEPLQRAARLAPNDGAARATYGWALWLLGQRAAARPEIAAGLRLSPSLPFALYAAGQVAMADGEFALALARFQTALEVTPANPALWSAAGDAALAQADYVTAELSYGNAAQASNDPAYTIALVRFYLDHGLGLSDAQALQLAFAAVQRFPANEPLVFLEGQIYDSLGQQTEAYYSFQRAVALDPTDPGPWLYLGRYAAASGDVIPAVAYLRTALALQPAGAYAAQARQTLARFNDDTLYAEPAGGVADGRMRGRL